MYDTGGDHCLTETDHRLVRVVSHIRLDDDVKKREMTGWIGGICELIVFNNFPPFRRV